MAGKGDAMRPVRHLWCILCCALSLCVASVSCAAARPSAETIAPLLDDFLQRTHTPGVVAALSFPDMERPLVVARGLAGVENTVPLRPDAVFRYGSITKVFTAMHVKQCMETGKLSPETDIRPFFPELKLAGPITVFQLMTHTSGLPELLEQPEVVANPTKAWTAAELLAAIGGKALLFEPGTQQKYNNTGYFLLEQLLEKVDVPAKAWLERQREELGMPSLRVEDDSSIVPLRATGYSLTKEGFLCLPLFFSATLASGSGDLGGNALDLLRLPQFFKRYGLLPEKAEPLRLKDGTPAVTRVEYGGLSYNLDMLEGINLYDMGKGRFFFGKDGMIPGYASQFVYDPETGAAAILLLNQENACFEAFKLALGLLDVERAGQRRRN